MKVENSLYRIGFWSLLILSMLVNILGQAIHETGHHLVYQVMGRDPVWGFTKIVQIWDIPPLTPEAWTETSFEGEPGWLKVSSAQESLTEKVISTAAGPLAGLLAAVMGLGVMWKSNSMAIKQVGLALTISISLAAVLYYLRSGSRIGGDEYYLADLLNISVVLINLFFGLSFAACLFFAIRALPTWQSVLKWLVTVLLGSAGTGALLFFADDYVISQVNVSNPRFQPILGYAFPVFLVNALALIGIWVWYTRQKKL